MPDNKDLHDVDDSEGDLIDDGVDDGESTPRWGCLIGAIIAGILIWFLW